MRCHWPIADLPGLDPTTTADLAAVGIVNTLQLVNFNPQQLAAVVGTRPGQKILALANLAQVPSVGCQYCGLLLHAGVASIEQLSQSSPQQLHRLVLRLHVALLQRRDLTPGVNQVQTWVQQAKTIVSG